MPTYDYVCDSCGESFEIYHSITEDARKECPSCGKPTLRRLIGPGGALIFKGTGFYATDYRKSTPSKGSDSGGSGGSSGEKSGAT